MKSLDSLNTWTRTLLVLILFLLSAIVWSVCTSRPSQATTVLRQSFAALVQKAETIVVGTVTAIEAKHNTDTGRPYTYVTVTDLDVRKGVADQTMTLRLLGGPTPSGRFLRIGGAPRFQLGDRVVLFVAGNGSQAVPLVGMWQGVYRVLFDAERAEEVVYTDGMQPLTALPAVPDGARVLEHGPATSPLTTGQPLALDALLDAIDREVGHD